MEKITRQMHEDAQKNIQYTHELFCLRDVEAQGFGLPQPAINGALFLREMEQVFKNPDHPITKYPDKFEIYQCGSYDYRTGTLIPSELRFVGLVADFRPKMGYPEPVVQRN